MLISFTLTQNVLEEIRYICQILDMYFLSVFKIVDCTNTKCLSQFFTFLILHIDHFGSISILQRHGFQRFNNDLMCWIGSLMSHDFKIHMYRVYNMLNELQYKCCKLFYKYWMMMHIIKNVFCRFILIFYNLRT